MICSKHLFFFLVRNRTAVRWQCKEVGALFDYNIKIICYII